MADTRKTPDAHEGPRAIPEERWEQSAQAERRLDELVQDGIPTRDEPAERYSAHGDENLPPAMKKSVEEEDETVAEQSRVGMDTHGDKRS